MAELTFDLAPTCRLPNFRRLFGSRWEQLPLHVRRRFDAHGAVVYPGTMDVVRCSMAGRLIAHVCRLLGTPLAFRSGENIAARVAVYPTANGRGMVWAREYDFDPAPIVASSVKTWHPEYGLMECVSGGLGMLLEASVEHGSIVFTSREYFLEVGPVHIRIPDWMTPGQTRVVHRDLGGHRFVFELSITSPWLGETFYQYGIFSDERGSS